MHKFIVLMIILLFFLGCKSNPVKENDTAELSSSSQSSSSIDTNVGCEYITDPADKGWLDNIKCHEDYQEIAGGAFSDPDWTNPDRKVIGSVRIVYDFKEQHLYFMDSKRFDFHFEFCREILGWVGEDNDYYDKQYKNSSERKYYQAELNEYPKPDPDVYALELPPTVEMTPEQMIELYRVVQEHFELAKIHFMPTSEAHKELGEQVRDSISVIDREVVDQGQVYQPLNLATNYGYVVFEEKVEAETPGLDKRTIVVTKGVPNDIPVVAGIITQDFQTPLSHVNILSKNRGTPNMGLKGAWENDTLRALEGKLVKFVVESEQYTIQEATESEAQEFWDSQEVTELLKLDLDDSTSGLFTVAELNYTNVNLVGAKASNFAEMKNIETGLGDFPLPEGGFAIPFYYYRQHVNTHGISTMISGLLNDSLILNDAEQRQLQLEAIRDSIKNAEIDPDLLNDVVDAINANGQYTRMRFRSSTNAEDIEGFNGAGLYTSKTGIVGDPDKPIEDAIRKVWASVWSYRAFEERSYFKIDHNHVAMGVLVHRSFPEELANGVAITANIYDEKPGITVNVQPGEESVVNPDSGVIAEQFVFYTDKEDSFENPSIEYIANTSLQDENVLSEEEIVLLAKHLEELKKHFYPLYGDGKEYDDFAMDVEFKFDSPDRKLYIKQARPY